VEHAASCRMLRSTGALATRGFAQCSKLPGVAGPDDLDRRIALLPPELRTRLLRTDSGADVEASSAVGAGAVPIPAIQASPKLAPLQREVSNHA
jgi:hypothetical protein